MITLEEIKKLDREMITVSEVASVIGIAPTRISYQAKTDPSFLGFNVVVAGDTVRIPRLAFIAWMEGHPCKGGD